MDVIAWTSSLQPGVVVREDGNPTVYRMGRYREWDTTMPHSLNLVDWLAGTQAFNAVWEHYLSPAGFLAAWIGRMKKIPLPIASRS